MAAEGGTSASSLESGRRLYTGRCATCHSIDPVTKHSPDRWRAILDDMANEAKLSASEKSAGLTYILAPRSVATTAAPHQRSGKARNHPSPASPRGICF